VGEAYCLTGYGIDYEFDRGEFGFVPSSFESRLNNCLLCGLFFSSCQRIKFFDRSIILQRLSNPKTELEWRRK
jgi:hypothetical protein